MYKKISRVCIALGMAGLMALIGCAANKTVKGGAIGAGAGGIIGGIIGKQTGNTAVGAIVGAAVGGSAGALIGRNMDKQADEMKQKVDDAKIERVGEGIKITLASGILFKTNAADLQTEAKQNVEKLAQILKEYPDTNIRIEGHTDSDGTDAYNQKLSERRAQAVASYAQTIGVSSARFQTIGYGEAQPLASNSTADGKQANRRVEISVTANDKMKQAAQEGKL